MPMLDWNRYRGEVVAGVAHLRELSPDTVRGYVALNGASARSGHFDDNTRELMALAVAITLRCDGCITVHADAAKRAGATEEALGVAISVNAGAALVYATRTLDAFAEAPAP